MRIGFGHAVTTQSGFVGVQDSPSPASPPAATPMPDTSAASSAPADNKPGFFKRLQYKLFGDPRTIEEKLSSEERKAFDERYGGYRPKLAEAASPATEAKTALSLKKRVANPQLLDDADRYSAKKPNLDSPYKKFEFHMPTFRLEEKAPATPPPRRNHLQAEPTTRLVGGQGVYALTVKDANGKHAIPDGPTEATTGSEGPRTIWDSKSQSLPHDCYPDFPDLAPKARHIAAVKTPRGQTIEPPSIWNPNAIMPTRERLLNPIGVDSAITPLKLGNDPINRIEAFSKSIQTDLNDSYPSAIHVLNEGHKLQFTLNRADYVLSQEGDNLTILRDLDNAIQVLKINSSGQLPVYTYRGEDEEKHVLNARDLLPSKDNLKLAAQKLADPLTKAQIKAYAHMRNALGSTLQMLLDHASFTTDTPVQIRLPETLLTSKK